MQLALPNCLSFVYHYKSRNIQVWKPLWCNLIVWLAEKKWTQKTLTRPRWQTGAMTVCCALFTVGIVLTSPCAWLTSYLTEAAGKDRAIPVKGRERLDAIRPACPLLCSSPWDSRSISGCEPALSRASQGHPAFSLCQFQFTANIL